VVKSGLTTVDDYIASRPAAVQKPLKKLRGIVRKALPGAEEVISYQIPAYRLHGRIVLFFAGWTDHYSLYPAGSRLPSTFKKELARYELSRGTIRFPLSEPIPEKLITRVAKFRAKEAAERARASVRKKKTAAGARRKSKRKPARK
jgi:uncharacterized protein YdhG (YjbR/CyaY superfamily)